jgi:hypothetical protein
MRKLNAELVALLGRKEEMLDWEVYDDNGLLSAFGFIFDASVSGENLDRLLIEIAHADRDLLRGRIEDVCSGKVYRLPRMEVIVEQQRRYREVISGERFSEKEGKFYFSGILHLPSRDLVGWDLGVKAAANYGVKPIFLPEWIRMKQEQKMGRGGGDEG